MMMWQQSHFLMLMAALVAVLFQFAVLQAGAAGPVCKSGEGVNSKGKCQRCPYTTWSSGGANATCTKCADGVVSVKTRNFCENCPRGTYGKGGRCFPCPKGTYSKDPASTTCTKCSKTTGIGYYPGFGVCGSYIVCSPNTPPIFKGCPEGSCWSDDRQCCASTSGPVSKCIVKPAARCASGTGLKGNYCVKCNLGYYNDGTSPLKCLPCPAGTTSSANRKFCNQCGPLKFSPGGSKCRRCPPGTWADNVAGIGAAKCTRCTKKTVVDKNGSTCSDYIICEPGKFPKISFCKEGECFLSDKACCVKSSDPKLKCVWKP